MVSRRASVCTILSFFSPQLSLLTLSRRVVLGCALVGALLCPQRAVGEDYSTPDYYISADPTPYFATTAVTIVYSASNLSDVPAPATTVAFSMALLSDSSRTWDLGQADVPAIDPWQYVTQTVTFPLPADSPAGTTDMQLIANINPAGDNGEVQTDNNIVTSSFEIQMADSSVPSDSSATPTAPADPPAPSTSSVTPTTPAAPTSTSTSSPSSSPVDTSLVGFGSSTPGGTGQPVYTVTSLASSGPGTLSDAISQGNRYIKFAVAGTINLSDGIETKGPFITIDGFSAPAPGITLKGGGLYMMGYSSQYDFDNHSHDIIVRGIRVRDSFDDAFRVAYNAYNIVIDHVSALGAGDGSIDITEDSHDVTVSWSIFADPLSQRNSLLAYRAWHITMHHNLFIASSDRDPFLAYDYSGTPSSNLNLDFWNNLVWDWGGGSGTKIQYGSKANVVNNYYDSPNGDNPDALIVCSSAVPAAHEGDCENYDPSLFAQAYVAGNVNPELASINAVGAGAVSAPFPGEPVTTQDACAAAADVRTEAGALPHDSLDESYLSTITIQSGLCP